MPQKKPRPCPPYITLVDDGSIMIAFNGNAVHLNPILMGQYKELREDLKARDAELAEYVKAEGEALREVIAWNAEHKDDEGFEPKEFDHNERYMSEFYAPWWQKVDEMLASDGAHLPADPDMWPPSMTMPETIQHVTAHWMFVPLAPGDE